MSGCNVQQPPELSPLAQKGKVLYASHCMACHNPNPSKDGNLGPAIAGSSYELLKLRVREGKYPLGYQPKRNTHLMVPLPHLTELDLQALREFLKDGLK